MDGHLSDLGHVLWFQSESQLPTFVFKIRALRHSPSWPLEKNAEAGNVLNRGEKRLRVRNRECSAALALMAE